MAYANLCDPSTISRRGDIKVIMETKLPTIKIRNIILRELRRSDFVDLFRIGSNPKMCEFLNWGPYKNINEALYTLDEIYLKRPLDNLPIGYAIEMSGKMIGLIEYHTYNESNNSIEIGFFLEEDGIPIEFFLCLSLLLFLYLFATLDHSYLLAISVASAAAPSRR